jgi:hypothetical protein
MQLGDAQAIRRASVMTLLLYWSPAVSTLADGWNVQGGDCSVSMEVPGDLAANVDLHTGDGHIDLDMPVTTEGRIHPSGIQGKLNSDSFP